MPSYNANSERKILEKLREAIEDYDEDKSEILTNLALEQGFHPLEILDVAITPVLKSMGEAFEIGEIYLIELMAAARAVEASMRVLRPALEKRGEEPEYLGNCVIGTIEGDIHDIGKSIVASLLRAAGFKVIDLGKDVPLGEFVEAAMREDADIVGVSALLTTTMQKQRELMEMFIDSRIRDRIGVMIGGAPSSEAWAEEIGADGYAPDATEAVKLAKQLVSSREAVRKGAGSVRE
jgi:corrinoid protein of di/trimethylamine methyltransferase